MQILRGQALNYRQLQSAKSKELYSQTAMLSTGLNSQRLFAHIDTLGAGLRASAPHSHSLMEEIILILEGEVIAIEEEATGGNTPAGASAEEPAPQRKVLQESLLKTGDAVLFSPGRGTLHHLHNRSDKPAKFIAFADRQIYDRVLYANASPTVPVCPKVQIDPTTLRDHPVARDDWESYCKKLQIQLQSEQHPATELQLHEQLGIAYRILEKLTEAETHATRALALSLDHPMPGKKIQNMIRLAHVYQWQKAFAKAEVLFAQAHLLVELRGCSEALFATLLQHQGKLFFDQGDYKKAESYFQRAFEIRSQGDEPELIESSRLALVESRKRLAQ